MGTTERWRPERGAGTVAFLLLLLLVISGCAGQTEVEDAGASPAVADQEHDSEPVSDPAPDEDTGAAEDDGVDTDSAGASVPSVDASAVLTAAWQHACLAVRDPDTGQIAPDGDEVFHLDVGDTSWVASVDGASLSGSAAPLAVGDATGDGVEELFFLTECHTDGMPFWRSVEVWTAGPDGPLQLPSLVAFDRYLGELDDLRVEDAAVMTGWEPPMAESRDAYHGVYRHTWDGEAWDQHRPGDGPDGSVQTGTAAGGDADGPIDAAWLDTAEVTVACAGQEQVRLQDGIGEVEGLTVTRVLDVAFGDLTGDGHADAAMMLHCARDGASVAREVVVFDHTGAQLRTTIDLTEWGFAAWPLFILEVDGGSLPAGYGAVDVGIADPWGGYPFTDPPADHFEHGSSLFFFRDGTEVEPPAGSG